MAIQKVIEIVAETKQALKDIKELYNEQLDLQKDAIKSQDKLNDEVADLGKSAQASKKGFSAMSTGLKAVGASLKAAGIGLFIGALVLLKKALTSNKKAMKALSVVTDFVTAAVGEIVDVIDEVVTTVSNATNGFESLGKVLGGLFSLFLLPLKGAFIGIGLGISQAQLIWEKSFFGDGNPETIKSLNKSIDESKQKLIEIGEGVKKAGKEVVDNFAGAISEVGQLGSAVVDAIGDVDINATVLRNKTEKANKEAEERRLKAFENQKKIDNLDLERLKKIQDFKNDFKKQNEDLDAKTLEEKLELEKERAQADLDNLIGTETEKREAKIRLDEFYNQREDELKEQRRLEQEQKDAEADKLKAANDKKAADREIADAKAVLDAKKSIRDSEINNISAGIGLIKSLGEKSRALQAAGIISENAVGVGKTIISTQAANAAATAKYAAIPGGLALAAAERTANNISAGIGIASSVLATKKALSQLKQGGSVDGGGAGSGGGQSASAPSFNVVQGTGTNQIAEGLQGSNEPVKAFVVSSDVTTSQSLDRNIIDDASI